MGDEYTWLVGLDEKEDVKAIRCRIEREGDDDGGLSRRDEDKEVVLVNAVRNEDISADLYSEFLGLQQRVASEDCEGRALNKFNNFEDNREDVSKKLENSEPEEKELDNGNEDINTIAPYKDSNERVAESNESRLSSSELRTHSLMNLQPHPDSNCDKSNHYLVRIGDRTYEVTASLLESLKGYLSQTMEGAEVYSREGCAALSKHSGTFGRALSHHFAKGAGVVKEFATVQMISAVIRESCHFTLDRTKLFTKWYARSILSDDPEMAYRKSIRNTSSLTRPDCATTSLRLNSSIVKRRAMFSTISWMDRQLLWVTRDEGIGEVTRNVKKKTELTSGDEVDKAISNQQAPFFQHCQSIYKSPTQAAFITGNAYDPTVSKGSEFVRPTAAATANYFDLLDALMSSAFDHNRGQRSAEAYAILVDMITPPDFEEKSSCADCFEPFSVVLFRHHCRNCGRSICRACSSPKNKRIPKYGYTDPVRVCFPCAVKVEVEATMERVQWRLMRIRDYLHNQLIPFFSHGIDRGIDKANRVVDLGLFMLKSALMCNYPAMLIVETVDILKRYGMAGLAGVLMRNDFVEAVETLKKISGMDKHYPISLSELTACIYYRLAIERGIRGTDPDGEHRLHFPEHAEPDDPPYATLVPLPLIETIVDYASMALMLAYEEDAVECQRIAATQGYACICSETISKAEKPAFGIYVSYKEHKKAELDNTSDKASNDDDKGYDFNVDQGKGKEVVLVVRGTLSIHDVVTDIRAAPHPFPPSQEEILSWIYQGNDSEIQKSERDNIKKHEKENTDKPDEDLDLDGDGDCSVAVDTVDTSDIEPEKDDWEWLLTSSTKSYAATGIYRSSCWLLAEVGRPLLELMNQGYHLVICGHSLGAAVAAVVAYMLREVGISNLHCYAFAPPSFVDETTADKMSSFVTTVILHDDIIPRVTPQSIRHLMKDVLFFRSEVFKYLEQDWKDAIERAASIWVPRTRDADKIHTKDCANKDMEKLEESKSSIAVDDTSEEEGEVEIEVKEDNISQYLLVLEEKIIPLWCPGKIVHIYSRNGVYEATYVPRTFPNLRRIIVQGNIFRDHSGQSIFEALLEVRAARSSSCAPPNWTPYNDPASKGLCKCCQSKFTWHSTFRGEAQEYRERYNCRSCGGLVCGPCSRNRQPVLRLGLITPSRICDSCFYNGYYSSERNPT